MRGTILFFISMFAVVVMGIALIGVGFITAQVIDIQKLKVTYNGDDLMSLVNDWRILNSIDPLIKDEKLCDIAEYRAYQITSNWEHDLIFSDLVYTKTSFKRAGENLARDFDTAEDALTGWLASKTHRENIENSYTHSCVRCNGNNCVQIFGGY